MASADFSQPILRHCCRRTPVPRRGWEISQGKTLILHSVAAGFTCARVCLNIGRPGPWPSYPTAPASYPVPVRQLRALPPASSPPRLATTQLPLASGSVQPARKGLAPPTSTPCLAHREQDGLCGPSCPWVAPDSCRMWRPVSLPIRVGPQYFCAISGDIFVYSV